jgi:two-component system response regulator MprA
MLAAVMSESLPRSRVLVVDDNPGVRELAATVLRAGGYEVAAAPHGRAALDVVHAFRPDVILLDSCMPVMDGREFARRYRELPAPHAPILMLTGEPDGRARAGEIEAAGYLGKPFAPAALLRLVGAAGRPPGARLTT